MILSMPNSEIKQKKYLQQLLAMYFELFKGGWHLQNKVPLMALYN